jgi:U3 small nucleolar RNA-associated protein 14
VHNKLPEETITVEDSKETLRVPTHCAGVAIYFFRILSGVKGELRAAAESESEEDEDEDEEDDDDDDDDDEDDGEESSVTILIHLLLLL